MAIECFVITLIFTAIVFSFAHANRLRWVMATIPLGILPLSNCAANLICTQLLGAEMSDTAALTVILISAMASCIWIGAASCMLNSKKTKIPYIVVGFLFNIILGIILVNYYLQTP